MSETNAYDLSLIVLQHAMILETAKSNPKILKAVTALAQRLQSGLFCDNFSEDELKFLKKMWKKLYTEYKELLEPLKNDIKELFSPQETITTEPLADKIAETKHFSDSNAVAPIEQNGSVVYKTVGSRDMSDMLRKSINGYDVIIDGYDFSDSYLADIKMCFDVLDNSVMTTTKRYNVVFKNCKFFNLDLSGKRFEMKVTFNNCVFNGNTDFRGCVFEQDVSFAHSVFNGITHFEDTNFLKNADFRFITTRGTYFLFSRYKLENTENAGKYNYTWSFKGAHFNSPVSYFRRKFPERLDFSDVSFGNDFYFTECKFSQKMRLQLNEVKFSSESRDFENCVHNFRIALEKSHHTIYRNELLDWEKHIHNKKTQQIEVEGETLITPKAAAKILKLTESTLKTMRSRDPERIKFIKKNNKVFYYKSAVEQYAKIAVNI